MSWKRITAATLTAATLAALGTQVFADDAKDEKKSNKPRVTLELDGEGVQLRSNIARRVLGRFWIGIHAAPTSPALQAQLGIDGGVTVIHALEGHAASSAGVQKHDVITGVNDSNVSNIAEFMHAIEENGESEAKLTLYRAGKKKTITVKPQSRPEENIRLPFDADENEFKEHSERISKWLEDFGKEGDFEKFRMFRFGPGIVIDEELKIDGQDFNAEELEKRVREALRKRFDDRAQRKVEEPEEDDSDLNAVRRELKQLRKDLDNLKKSNDKKD